LLSFPSFGAVKLPILWHSSSDPLHLPGVDCVVVAIVGCMVAGCIERAAVGGGAVVDGGAVVGCIPAAGKPVQSLHANRK